MEIRSVTPGAALPGGLIHIELEGLENPIAAQVFVGGARADLLGASGSRITARVPAEAGAGVVVREGGESSAPLRVGRLVNAELQPVSNPVIGPDGSVYVTYSGARGEKVPFGVYRITPDGKSEPFLAEIVNPTGLAPGPDGCLYVTSRHTGMVYRSTMDKQVEEYADGLGLATGLVFDSRGNLYVGDRSGSIHKVTPGREKSVHCHLEPSVSAYHLAIDEQDRLYVTGPTLSTQDSIYRVSPGGEAEPIFRGLGRPQGLAFDAQGSLQVAASFRGLKGVFTLRNGDLDWTLTGPMLVGLAHDRERSLLYLADHSSLFRIETG